MIIKLIEKLYKEQKLSKQELVCILDNINAEEQAYLYELATKVKKEHYGNGIFLRGLIEFSNHCKNDCYYCGIRSKNNNVSRYRLTQEQILDCCEQGYELGMRTFVLQGGEDPFYNDKMEDITRAIRSKFADCAITLSIGEQSYEMYKRLFEAGANRFLLRHETATNSHYQKLHPQYMSPDNRKKCLHNLKEIGYQTGAGFMVGSPYQTNEFLAEDLLFLEQLQPHMVGIGPFIPHKDSMYKDFPAGGLSKTLTMLALTRLMLPKAMIPSTTALETIEKSGRVHGYLAGANVIMVNISPNDVKQSYMLYDNKAFVNTEAAKSIITIKNEIESIGMELMVSIGNPAK